MSLIPTAALALLAAMQAPAQFQGYTSPPNGDTTGYWQQRVHYTITATLDEPAQRVRARATMTYVNNSPDTLREMFVHQYLNAFRPASLWSRVDEKEGRDRFQRLEEPDQGYERFTAPVRVRGTDVRVEYPGAPDSTVARFALPSPLVPGDSLTVEFAWDARPSTLPRRQGRRGRHWDLAQWYPKVAVYDRGGWQPNALQPAGELYGEFGTYDVTLFLANDQIVAATGVPVSGDPGYSRALRAGAPRLAATAYGDVGPTAQAPAGYRAVRYVARDVHHFAWTASPDYRYEGGTYARRLRPQRFRTWDSVSIHVLYRAGDDTTWGGQRALDRTLAAMRWLETLYGPYAYPQMTVVHRIDRGGTEFPMMQMNGSASQGLILHEGGHVWTYGILADNEWRSGWMDEGLTSYQTAWAQLLTPLERVRAGIRDSIVRPGGYRGRAARMVLPRFDLVNVNMARLDLEDKAQPLGTTAHEFRDFDTYNDMIYDRAEVMYGQLRDVMGDSLFVTFLRDYYSRWALKHVDERAMRASAERVSGRDLGWFFDQWVHRTGVMDYKLGRVKTRQDGAAWITEVPVRRVGKYPHPMPVGVRTDTTWTFARMKAPYRDEVLTIRTSRRPDEVRLDPFHTTWDWDRRNDMPWTFWGEFTGKVRYVFDWPFLEQTDREKRVLRYRPTFWYSDPGGGAIGLSERGNYLGFAHKSSAEVAALTRTSGFMKGYQLYTSIEDGLSPSWRAATAFLDDLAYLHLGVRKERVSGVRSREVDVAVTATAPAYRLFDEMRPITLAPELWTADSTTVDARLRAQWVRGSVSGSYWFARPSALVGWNEPGTFGKAELSVGRVQLFGENERASIRLYGGKTFGETPPQRGLYLSAQDPTTTFGNHWWRPRGAILKRPNVNWLPLGGPALRGYHWSESAEHAVGGNVELSRRLLTIGSRADTAGVWLSVFGDAAAGGFDTLVDAGPGITVRGKIYDWPVTLRFDFPLYVSEVSRAIDGGRAGAGTFAPRWSISFSDIW